MRLEFFLSFILTSFAIFYLSWRLVLYFLAKIIDPKAIHSFEKRTWIPAWLLFLGILGLVFSLESVFLPWEVTGEVQKTDQLLKDIAICFLIGAIGWWLVIALKVSLRYYVKKKQLEDSDEKDKKSIVTQIRFLLRIGTFLIISITVSLILLTLPGTNRIGWGLLSSAGVAGVIAGFAARPVLENLMAGVQIAFTQPIKINDVVVVEGEWGRIEEILMTHVIIRVWDKRRLVVPIAYFVQTPFQNWTINSTDLVGSVYLWLDYSIPIDLLRKKLQEIVESTDLWDGMVAKLHVTETNEKAMQIRAIVSAKDSPTGFELRCHVREKLIQFIQENYREGLPKFRLLSN